MEKKKTIILSVLGVFVLVISVFGATYAYFQAQGGLSSTTDIRVLTYTTDNLTFETGSTIQLYADQESFAEGKGNVSGETYASATLTANNKTNEATANYYVYLSIKNNTFTYTQDENTPELLLVVTDASGNKITSIDGLTYKTITDGNGTQISGFDITKKSGLITILNNQEISATPSKTDKWNLSITFVNYNFDQNENTGKSLSASLIIQKELMLSQYVLGLYTGVQGVNNIYYHDETLENGAMDYSYRFAGADSHDDYYTCTYNGSKVYSTRSLYDNNRSYEGDCDSVYSETIDGSTGYFDKSVYDTKVSVSWDSTSSKCLTSNGANVYSSALDNATESECSGYAYKINSSYFLLGLTSVGVGTSTLYEEAGGVDNNYVCFGSNDTPCPHENLYRIIGLIDGHVRLIKADVAKSSTLGTNGDYRGNLVSGAAIYDFPLDVMHQYITFIYKGEYDPYEVGAYSWNYMNDTEINNGHGSNTWSTSLLNKVNLNKNFLENIGSDWASKIATTTWKVGGIENYYNNSRNTYLEEIKNPSTYHLTDGKTEYEAKVGLMYISDYGFAYEYSHWNENVINFSVYNSLYNNWMQIGAYEWTLTRAAVSANGVVLLVIGAEYDDLAYRPFGVRPSFNLESSVKIIGGDGTKSSPLVIS